MLPHIICESSSSNHKAVRSDSSSHSVLHDWPDVKAVEILDTLRPSMKKGYSRLLIHEKAIGPPLTVDKTTADITMLGMLAAAERECLTHAFCVFEVANEPERHRDRLAQTFELSGLPDLKDMEPSNGDGVCD